jgi:uncharacterized protein
MIDEIKVFEYRKVDLKGATVIDGFPSVGLVSSVVANFIVNSLHLEQIGTMESPAFPTVSLIRDTEPQNPVRIYAGTKDENPNSEKVVAFISEFQPPPNLTQPIASAILDWAEKEGCGLILSPEGLVVEREGDDVREVIRKDETVKVYGVASTKNARELIATPDVFPFQEGVITGIAAVLLNEGKRRDFNVISLLAEAHPNYPDARAAASIIDIVSKLVLKTHIDLKPLYDEATRIESQIKSIQKQTVMASPPKHIPSPSMYG